MTELTECFRLNLTDTLSGYVKFLTDFLKGSGTSIIETKTEAEYLLLSFGQGSQNLNELLL